MATKASTQTSKISAFSRAAIGLTRGGPERSNGHRNRLHNPCATLEVKGCKITVRAAPVDAPAADLQKALARRDLIRFFPE